MEKPPESGFTLAETAIVLVVLALIVSMVLFGQEFFAAAKMRAQMKQLERFTTAVKIFEKKYGALPGDLTAAQASTFGMTARSGQPGHGDGNGKVGGMIIDFSIFGPETLLFWNDLTSSNLISENFSTATDTMNAPTSNYVLYYPRAKINQHAYVQVLSDDRTIACGAFCFAVGKLEESAGGFTPLQAGEIDAKWDDGKPLSGKIGASAAMNEYEGNFLPMVEAALEAAMGDGSSCVKFNGKKDSAAYRITGDKVNTSTCVMNFAFR
jgi:hypothetical protein